MKRLISWIIVVSMLFSLTAPSAFAIDMNSNEIFLKQDTKTTCTLSSAAMMLRRRAFMEGRSDWDSITENSIKSKAWAPGLRWNFSYAGYNVTSGSFSGSASDKKNKIINMLNEHPEGIVIYLYKVPGSSKQHAVLATDYDGANDILYVADPAGGFAKGRIPIMDAYLVGSSQEARIGNMRMYWYIKSGTSEISTSTPTPSHEHKSVYKYDVGHPHAYYIYCEECGYREYTGSYETLSNCNICHPHEHSWTQNHDSGHPHSVYRKCSGCGDIEYLGRNELISSCSQCYPLGSVVLTREFDKIAGTATFYRNNTTNATSYDLELYKDGRLYNTYSNMRNTHAVNGLQSGVYTAKLFVSNSATGQEKEVSCPSFTIVNKYDVSYNANGGENPPANQTKIQDVDLTITSSMPTKTGHIFKGWAPSKTATTAEYPSGGLYKKNAKITFYAVWEPEVYTINFDANGGKGELESTTIIYGNSMKMPNTIVKEGYYLKGWSASKTASEPDYRLNIDYKLTANTTLYAVWGNSTWSGAVASGFAGGDGSAENPYQISNASELAYLADKVNQQTSQPEYVHYILTDNINLGYEEWVPIGVFNNENQYFCGSFDGNGYTVSDLSISQGNSGYIGLFGYTKDSEIKNLTVAGDISGGGTSVGAIAGQSENLSADNCSISYVNVSKGGAFAGGMFGYVDDGNIKNCSANDSYVGVADGNHSIGIIVGKIKGNISDCNVISVDELMGTTDLTEVFNAGGICGEIMGDINKCTVSAAFLSANIKGTLINVGGITGNLNGKVNLCTVKFNEGIDKTVDGMTYKNSIYATGKNQSNIGGIAGECEGLSTITDCVYDGESISLTEGFDSNAGGIAGYFEGRGSKTIEVPGGETINEHDIPYTDGYSTKWFFDESLTLPYSFSYIISEKDNYRNLYPSYTRNSVSKVWDGVKVSEPSYNSETKTYTITNGAEFAWIAYVSNGKIKTANNFPEDITYTGYTIELANDIYMNNNYENYKNWEEKPPRNVTPAIKGFNGIFDGKNNVIKGAYLINQGLFTNIEEKGILKNLGIEESYSEYSVFGYSNDGSIINCHNSAIMNNSTGVDIGFVASNRGIISNSYNAGHIIYRKTGSIGGIAGNNHGTISYCYNAGDISIEAEFATGIGGISGNNNGSIDHCYNIGDIGSYTEEYSHYYISGIGNGGNVSYCYNSGRVGGNTYIAGIANNANISYCYNTGDIYGYNIIGEISSILEEDKTIEYCYAIGDATGDIWSSSIKRAAIVADVKTSGRGALKYCYADTTSLYNGTPGTAKSVVYKSDMSSLSNLPGFSATVWGIDSGKYEGKYPYLLSLTDTYKATEKNSVWMRTNESDMPSIDRCFANVNGIIFSNTTNGGAVSGGILGKPFGGIDVKSIISVADKISSISSSKSNEAKSGNIVGSQYGKIDNAYSYSSTELAATNTANAENAYTSQQGSTRTLTQLKRASFLNTVFGPDTYQSLDYLKENEKAVWVIKDGELPELYYNVLNDITISDVENGTISLDKHQAVDGEVVTVTATPAEGYILNKIYVNGEKIAGTTFEVAGNSDVYATFSEETAEYSVSITSNENADAGLVNVDEAQTFGFDDVILMDTGVQNLSAKDGEEIKVNTSAAQDYSVDAIYINGEELAGNSFILTEDTVVTIEATNISTDLKAVTDDINEECVGSYFATLSGSVEDDKDGVSRYIRYWSENDKNTVYTTDIEDGAGDYSVDIMPLTPNTKYYYQMTENGEIKSFTTLDEDYSEITGNPTAAPDKTIAPTAEPTPTLDPPPVIPTRRPTITTEPIETEKPDETEEPVETEDPGETDVPVSTKKPVPTQKPDTRPTVPPVSSNNEMELYFQADESIIYACAYVYSDSKLSGYIALAIYNKDNALVKIVLVNAAENDGEAVLYEHNSDDYATFKAMWINPDTMKPMTNSLVEDPSAWSEDMRYSETK